MHYVNNGVGVKVKFQGLEIWLQGASSPSLDWNTSTNGSLSSGPSTLCPQWIPWANKLGWPQWRTKMCEAHNLCKQQRFRCATSMAGPEPAKLQEAFVEKAGAAASTNPTHASVGPRLCPPQTGDSLFWRHLWTWKGRGREAEGKKSILPRRFPSIPRERG